jgi:hypothetical protein
VAGRRGRQGGSPGRPPGLVAVFPDQTLTLLPEPGLNTPGDPRMTLDRHAASHPITQSTPQSRPRRPSRLLPCHRQDDANLAFGATRHRDRIGADQALGGPERRPPRCRSRRSPSRPWMAPAPIGAGVLSIRIAREEPQRWPSQEADPVILESTLGRESFESASASYESLSQTAADAKVVPHRHLMRFLRARLDSLPHQCRPFQERARRDSNSRPSVP